MRALVERQIAIAKFPATINLAAKSRASSAVMLLGAPNLVQGGSWISVGYMSVSRKQAV